MAKGKTNDPLNLLVDVGLWDTPEVQSLIEQGHTVTAYDALNYGRIDGMLGARMWRMTPELIKYLPMAIKAIRKEKRDAGKPRGQKGKPKKAVRRTKKGDGGSAGNGEASVSGGAVHAENVVIGASESSQD